MNPKDEREVQRSILVYTDKLIEKINYGIEGNKEEQATHLIETLEDARKYFLTLEARYYPNTRSKEINGRLTILGQFLSGVITERKRIIDELEFQNSQLKRQ